MDELFTLIGKLYVDLVQSQKYIDSLQKQIQVKDQELSTIQNSINKKDFD
jgi:CHASE3 domain sensor protein